MGMIISSSYFCAKRCTYRWIQKVLPATNHAVAESYPCKGWYLKFVRRQVSDFKQKAPRRLRRGFLNY